MITTKVIGIIYGQGGQPAAGERVTARLKIAETDVGTGIVVPMLTIAECDEGGRFEIDLWPNSRGSAASQYEIKVGGGIWVATVTVPEVDSVNVSDIVSQAPYPSLDAAQIAIESAQLSAAQASVSAAEAAADRVATGEDAAQTAEDRIATAADRVQTALDVVATGEARTATAADRVQTGEDRDATAADRTQTGEDAVTTAADRVQTGIDVVATANAASAADISAGLAFDARAAAQTAQSASESAKESAETAATNAAASEAGALTYKTAAQTAQGLAETARDESVAAQTAAETAQAGAAGSATIATEKATAASDSATTAESAATQTGEDRVQTGLDRVQTGEDAVATAADRVQTGLDVVATANAATAASSSAAAAYQSEIRSQAIADALEYPIGINSIGIPGSAGFGVGVCPPESLPAGMTPLYGYTDPTHPNYGNYQFADGSIMVWVPRFYYRIAHPDNPTYAAYGVNSKDIKGVLAFQSRFDAEADGYALHRAFIDGGVEQPGFFVDKYMASKNALGSGFVASSIQGGDPISTTSYHNSINEITAANGGTGYYRCLDAAHARDGIDGEVNPDSIFFCGSLPIYAALADLAEAHGQAAVNTSNCAWYHATYNFPKGCNNNALGDTNDSEIAYTSDGYSNCGKTGSGTPFAKTTHNGQDCGVSDLNGLMFEVSIGMTCIATSKSITGISQSNPAVVTVAGHGLTTGQLVQLGGIDGMSNLNDKIYLATVLDADTFSLDGVDSSGFAAYTSGGSIIFGQFYAAKTATAMKDFTAGNSGDTDHWGAVGCEAMMDEIDMPFATDYPDNSFGRRWGNAAEQVLDEALTGDGWLRTGFGLPKNGQAVSSGGTNLFGTDYNYQYIRNELCPRSGGYWYPGSPAGVRYRSWGDYRTYSYSHVGFRCACYPVA